MASQRDKNNRNREYAIARSERADRAARVIFPILAVLIILATVGYFYGSSRVEINPGKTVAGNTTTQSAAAPAEGK